MLSFQQMFLRKAMNRANQLLANGDHEGARDEMAAYVKRFPRSAQGWSVFHWTVARAGGSIEDRLEVLRRAAQAVPYDVAITDALIHQLLDAAMLIGDERYLDEAEAAADTFEEVLGRSAESIVMRAVVAQFRRDPDAALKLCAEAEELLALHPQDHVAAKLGLCLASIPGHEQRGIDIAEVAAGRSKQYATFLYLIALVEGRDASKAAFYRDAAVRLGARWSIAGDRIDQELQQAREEIARQREFLAAP